MALKDRVARAAYAKAYRQANKAKMNAHQRAWLAADPERARERRRRQNLATFGLTAEQFDEMSVSQCGLCAICATTNGGRALCVDHNHATGEVRGLLCGPCNSAVGLLKEDPNVIRRAAEYIEERND